MHTLQEVRAEYDRLDRLIGIDTRMIELKISKRAVRQLGSFRSPTRGRGPLRITLSALILDDDEQFWDTVRHEYAHAAVYLLYPGQKHGHDQAWRKGQVHHSLPGLRGGEPLHPARQNGGPDAARPGKKAPLPQVRTEQLHAAGASGRE